MQPRDRMGRTFIKPSGFAAASATFIGGLILSGSSSPTLFAADTSSPPAVQKLSVVQATSACFSATIRVTGFLVARQEAIVNF